MVAMTTTGSVKAETVGCWTEMRSHSERAGLLNVGWTLPPAGLVEKTRNDAVRTMLGAFKNPQGVSQAQWLLQVDADMVFSPDSLVRILTTAYGSHPWADAVGGYCSLKGEMALPTLDTGLGIWESIYPGRGPIEVIRTGTAFLLVKRHVFERIPQPWFRTRAQGRQLDFMLELDNFARCKLDGKNPFIGLPGKPWERLLDAASSDPSAVAADFIPSEVGEDSGFCDRAKAAGFRLLVDTDIEVGHLDTVVVNSKTHQKKMREIDTQWLQCVGVA
jgi:hypothetical protein